jgi:hypothetical protein
MMIKILDKMSQKRTPQIESVNSVYFLCVIFYLVNPGFVLSLMY